MERLIAYTSISAVTLCSMLLALLIEAALLKAIFHFMSRMNTERAAELSKRDASVRGVSRSMLRDARNADL